MFEIYSKSVYELADKLPQWSSKDYHRRFNNAVASLLEEAGEFSHTFYLIVNLII